MITKRTDELRPGDVVSIYGHRRTIASVTPTGIEGLLRVQYEWIPLGGPGGGSADAEDEWQVDAPSKLDLAVQRAQELADQYELDGITGRDIEQLFELFRAAR